MFYKHFLSHSMTKGLLITLIWYIVPNAHICTSHYFCVYIITKYSLLIVHAVNVHTFIIRKIKITIWQLTVLLNYVH